MRKMMRFGLNACMVSAMMLGSAQADVIELTALGQTESGTAAIGGTFVVQEVDPDSSQGTGVLQPYLRLNTGGNVDNEHGFNTDLKFDKQIFNTDAAWSSPLLLGDIPVVTVNGVQYREFVLDINQINSGDNKFISLNQVQIFQADGDQLQTGLLAAGPDSAPLISFDSTSSTEVFRLNDPNDPNFTEVVLNYDLNAGSGKGDMFLYIADSLFDPNSPNQNIIFYSQFGSEPGMYETNDGFEEWAVRTFSPTPVPEPSSLALLTVVLSGSFLRRRKKAADQTEAV